jgi:glycerophosphoryl diester phosphodiesterase
MVIAHRGLVGPHRPENTLAAIEAAFVADADGVEVDLRLTADGVLVLSHDADLRRLTGMPLPVAWSRWTDLVSAAASAGLTLCRLEDVLDLAEGRQLILEVKQPPHGSDTRARTVTAVTRLLGSPGSRRGTALTVSSFVAPLLSEIRQSLRPGLGVRTALLGHRWQTASSVLLSLDPPTDVVE